MPYVETRTSAERNIRYSHIFDKTAEVLASTYGMLVAVQAAGQTYSAYLGSDQTVRAEAAKEFEGKRRTFFEFYEPNQIYIPKETRAKITEFVNTLSSLLLTTSMMNQAVRAQSRTGFDFTSERAEKLFETIPQLRAALDDDLQKQLGFMDN